MRIILVGFGVVGQSFVKILINNYVELVTIHGLRPRIVAIVDSKGATIDKKGLNTKRVLKIKKNEGTVAEDPQNGFPNLTPREVINNIEADILIEMTPTNIITGKPGFTHIEEGLKNKKHVITTNKGPLALALPALMELAEYNNVNLRFSGTVGGGTPILNFGKRCLMGDKILSIKGILNGTTNYILTEMTKKRVKFDIALRKAQKLGYAEKNPSLDINGLDAASKIVIISNWIMGKKITLKDVKITGIGNITVKDIENADEKGQVIKLLGTISDEITVKPTRIPVDALLNIPGILNAVTFHSQHTGEISLVGKGAGGMETASAVLRDLIDIKQQLVRHSR